ncbi:hypothetical protein ACOSP7_021818 [Xanthoceras sorbifolium]
MKTPLKPSYDLSKPPLHQLTRKSLKSSLTGWMSLKDDIRLDVKIKQPCFLTDAIGIARPVEELNELQKKGVTNFKGSIFGAPPKSSSNSLAGILGPAPRQKPSLGPNAFRKITSQEAHGRPFTTSLINLRLTNIIESLP